MKHHYFHRRCTHRMTGERRRPLRGCRRFARRCFSVSRANRLRDPSFRDKSQVGSLAGAAYLLKNNAGVLKASSR